MKNYEESYINIAQEIKNLIENKNIIDNDNIDTFVSTIVKKAEDFQPTLMLYGTYNSGKSTLLNALYGENLAKVGDVPETAEIIPYNWNNYVIYDSPGIDAPIEHEEITEEHLKKVEVILFVVSSDGAFEEKYIYEKVLDILKAEKPLLIILNNKSGIDPESEELLEAINAINARLVEVAKEGNIDNINDKVRIFWVDADTALDGKLQNEQALIDYSNIKIIEDNVNDILDKSDLGTVKNNLNRYIIDFINQIILKIDSNTDDSDIKNLGEQITKLEKEKEYNHIKIKTDITTKIQLLSDEIRGKLIDGEDAPSINEYINIEIQAISNSIETKMDSIRATLLQNEETFNASEAGIEISNRIVNTIRDESEELGNNDIFDNEYVSRIKEQLKQGVTNEKLVKEASVEVFKTLREYGVKGFKWRWSSTFSKWGDRIAKGLGPAVKVISSLYEAYQANAEHDRMIEEKKKFAQNAKNEAEKLAKGLQQDIDIALDESLERLFMPLINNKREQVNILRKNQDEDSTIKDRLFGIKGKLSLG